MKNLFLLLFTSLCLLASAQRKVDGFYSGILFNDTTRMVQKYELALAEYRGKISGYSYVTFVSNDTFYWGIRKVKAEVIGDSLIVKDDKIVANNFPEAPAKGVGRIITIPLNGQDSVVTLNGRWKTNQTKRYYSVPGSIDLDRSTDSTGSALIRHLKELGIIHEPRYAAVVEQPKPKEKKAVEKTETVVTPVQPQAIENKPAKLPYAQRKIKLQATIEVESDSLLLAFFDNGVVDGDSVSVYLNGQVLVSNAKLQTAATKMSVNVKDLTEAELLLVAENLGTLPPNTGLVTIRDGEKYYQVNFSADMQTNASILIRKKKK